MSEALSVATGVQETPPLCPAPPAMPQPVRQGGNRLLDGLLELADALRAQGKLHQAIEVYFTLVEDHRDTDQGGLAFDRLVQVAEGYDEAGERHQARSLYERLLLSES